MFCCGWSVASGVKLILCFHLLACVFYIGSGCSNLLFHIPQITDQMNTYVQLFFVGFGLLGIPIILAALHGVSRSVEASVRLYLYYLFATCIVDVIHLASVFATQDPCLSINATFSLRGDQFGESYICGWFRMGAYFFTGTVVLTEVYCLWCVWTVLEDMRTGMRGPDLSDLTHHSKDLIERLTINGAMKGSAPYAEAVGVAHNRLPGPYPFKYGTVDTVGMPATSTILGGGFHDTRYPADIA